MSSTPNDSFDRKTFRSYSRYDLAEANMRATVAAAGVGSAKADLLTLRAEAAAASDAPARAAVAVRLAELQTQVGAAVGALAAHAAVQLPGYDVDPAADLDRLSRWAGVSMLLGAGVVMGTVVSESDVDTALAIRAYGPAWIDAQSHPAATSAVVPVPDQGQLARSIESRLAELTDPTLRDGVTAAVAAAHSAAGVSAYVTVSGAQLDADLAGVVGGQTAAEATAAAETAEQSGSAGLPIG